MTVAFRSLDNGSTTDNLTAYTTASVAPGADALLLLWVQVSVASGTAPRPLITGNGLTWVQIANDDGFRTSVLYRAMGPAPTAGPVTIEDGTGVGYTSVMWSLFEFTGVDTTGADGSGAVAQISGGAGGRSLESSATLPVAPAVDSATAYFHSHNENEPATPRPGWTEVTDQPQGSPQSGFESQYRLDGEQTGSATFATSSFWRGFIVEVKAGVTNTPAIVTAPAPPLTVNATAPAVVAGTTLSGPTASLTVGATTPQVRAAACIAPSAATLTVATAAPAVTGGTGAPPPPYIAAPGVTLRVNTAGATLTANATTAALLPNATTATLAPVNTAATWRLGVSRLKQNDTAPSAEATLTDGDTPVDLTTATGVMFNMAVKGSPTKVHAAAVVSDALAGTVRYDWQIGDTDVPGSYQVEWEVTWGDGTVQTFPPDSYLTLTITRELDTSG